MNWIFQLLNFLKFTSSLGKHVFQWDYSNFKPIGNSAYTTKYLALEKGLVSKTVPTSTRACIPKSHNKFSLANIPWIEVSRIACILIYGLEVYDLPLQAPLFTVVRWSLFCSFSFSWPPFFYFCQAWMLDIFYCKLFILSFSYSSLYFH